MPWWLWLFIAYWLIAGLISAWYWWDLGSMLEFAFYFTLGFAITPVTAIIFLTKKGSEIVKKTLKVVQERRALRKAKKLQKFPVVH